MQVGEVIVKLQFSERFVESLPLLLLATIDPSQQILVDQGQGADNLLDHGSLVHATVGRAVGAGVGGLNLIHQFLKCHEAVLIRIRIGLHKVGWKVVDINDSDSILHSVGWSISD